MGYKYSTYVFPKRMFPDVELGRVVLTENTLSITIKDSTYEKTGNPASEWLMSREDYKALFYGKGKMIFFYEGPATLKWRNLHKQIWYEGGRDLLPHLADLEIVRREPNPPILEILNQRPDFSIDLQFSNRKKGFVLYIQLEKVTRFEWSGEIYDEYSDPERFR